MKTLGIIEDAELGVIHVHENVRSRHVLFKVREGCLHATVWPGCSSSTLTKAIADLRPRLLAMLQRQAARQKNHVIHPVFRIDTPQFCFRFETAHVRCPEMHQRRGELVCRYPEDEDFSDRALQNWVVVQIEESLRQHARVIFGERMRQLAAQRGLHYESLSIHRTRGRWGSCNSRGSINLSLFLMLLPLHLQDYVMQHELTHLVEMNHGPRFWKLLDEAVGGHGLEYREQLKKFDTNVFTLL